MNAVYVVLIKRNGLWEDRIVHDREEEAILFTKQWTDNVEACEELKITELRVERREPIFWKVLPDVYPGWEDKDKLIECEPQCFRASRANPFGE